MQEHYCDKCFRLIKTGMEHQDWCPKAIDIFGKDNPITGGKDPLAGFDFEDLMNGINKQ